MEFQAAPIEQVQLEDSIIGLDTSIGMSAATEADDLLQHLSSMDALHAAPALEDVVVETVVNESVTAEPFIEEAIQQMQQSGDIPLLLIASTFALGIVIFLAVFLRRRRGDPRPKSTKASEEEVLEPVVDASAADEAPKQEVLEPLVDATATDEATPATEAVDPKVESTAVVEESLPTAEVEVLAVESEVSPRDLVVETPEIPRVSATEREEKEEEIPALEPEVAPIAAEESRSASASSPADDAAEEASVVEDAWSSVRGAWSTTPIVAVSNVELKVEADTAEESQGADVAEETTELPRVEASESEATPEVTETEDEGIEPRVLPATSDESRSEVHEESIEVPSISAAETEFATDKPDILPPILEEPHSAISSPCTDVAEESTEERIEPETMPEAEDPTVESDVAPAVAEESSSIFTYADVVKKAWNMVQGALNVEPQSTRAAEDETDIPSVAAAAADVGPEVTPAQEEESNSSSSSFVELVAEDVEIACGATVEPEALSAPPAASAFENDSSETEIVKSAEL